MNLVLSQFNVINLNLPTLTKVMFYFIFAMCPLSILAQEEEATTNNSIPMVSPLISKEDNKLIIDYYRETSQAEGTADELKKLKRTKLDATLAKLESVEAKAVLCRIHGDDAASEKDYVEAIRTYKLLTTKYPGASRHSIHLEELLYQAGLAGEHATRLSAALAVEKLDIDSSKKLDAMRQAASAYVLLEQFSSAAEIAEGLYTKYPQDAERAIEKMTYIGGDLIRAEQFLLAQRVLVAAYTSTRSKARKANILGHLAHVSQRSGDIERAIKYRKEMIRLLPDDQNVPSYQFSIAGSLFDLGQYKESNKYYQAVLNSDIPSKGLASLKKLSAKNIKSIENIKTIKQQ